MITYDLAYLNYSKYSIYDEKDMIPAGSFMVEDVYRKIVDRSGLKTTTGIKNALYLGGLNKAERNSICGGNGGSKLSISDIDPYPAHSRHLNRVKPEVEAIAKAFNKSPYDEVEEGLMKANYVNQ